MPDKKAKVRAGARRSFLDKASIAIARRMYDDGVSIYSIASYIDASISYMARLLKEFERGMHKEPVLYVKKEVPTKSATIPGVGPTIKLPVAKTKKAKPAEATKPTVTKPLVAKAESKKYPELFKDKEMPVKPEQAICATKSRTFSGLKKCPNEGCGTMIKGRDLECPECYHLSLAGRPQIHKTVQYVGGLLK